jgi:hypothetical protein
MKIMKGSFDIVVVSASALMLVLSLSFKPFVANDAFFYYCRNHFMKFLFLFVRIYVGSRIYLGVGLRASFGFLVDSLRIFWKI